jgi:hypothetical protein
MSLELEIEATRKGNKPNNGVENLRISKEEEVEVAMEVQVESLKVTTSILDNIDIPVERAKESIPIRCVNTNEEQTKEEVVVIGAKQPKKKKNKAINIEMEEKEIDKPSQVNEFQLSLAIVIAMSRVGKEWEDITDQFLVTIKIT